MDLRLQGPFQGAVERACVKDAFVKRWEGYAGKPDLPRKGHREKRERERERERETRRVREQSDLTRERPQDTTREKPQATTVRGN